MTQRDPFKIGGPTCISFSGGRTSGYLLWRVLHAHGGKLPADAHVIFANTETTLLPSPVCPYCGFVHRDAWEWNFGPGLDGDTEVSCHHCDEEFHVRRVVTVDYTTMKGATP